MQPKVLLVEDDPAIARTAGYALQREGFAVEHVLLARDARERMSDPRSKGLAVVLDLGLPDGSGLDLCRQWRRAGTLPIVILTARGEEVDRVLGLELGADDYLVKPFSPRELCARLRALLRRSEMAARPAPPVNEELLECDRERARVRLGSAWLTLTRLEFGLLSALMRSPGRVWSREALLGAVWGLSSTPTDRTVDTHVKTLRAKLRAARPELALIVTHRGIGYSLDWPDPP